MEDIVLNDLEAAKMLVKILLSKGAINEQTANAIFEKINEMHSMKKTA